MEDPIKILGVQDSYGKILENEYEVIVDCSGQDYRKWWFRLWDWIRGVKWKASPIVITLPDPSKAVGKNKGPFRIKKIDATDNSVIIVQYQELAQLHSQYETWSNGPSL